ncbi:hypothetical protein [Pyxidicoccus parkwayensis]|uniref:hypothetical protein n=1 Tax=Pyxidicoccus parkwayensis TaxID=2813578 RepID=UPI0027D9A5C2|nr:hypothetical protein [Pyxidicoccus parkwaysis]
MLAPVRRVQRRLNAVAWAEAGLAPVWATATACVLARLLLRGAVVWALPPLLAAGFAWWFLRARSCGVSLEHAAVLADRSANAGGLLLTRLERPVGEWELTVNQLAGAVKTPEVQWRRPVGALLGALLFTVVGFLLPLPAPRVRPANAAAAAKVAAVQAQAEALAKEEVLDEAVKDELRRLAEEVAEGRFDSGDWEAADAMEKRLAEKAAEAAAELSRASDAARELEEALGAAGGAEATSREREELERALMELSGGDSNGATKNGGEDSQQQRQQAQGDTGAQGQQQSGDSQQAQAQQGQQGQQGQQSQQGQQGQDGQQGQQSAAARARSQASGSPDQIASLRQSLERRRQALENRFDPQKNNSATAQSQQRSGQGQQGQSGQGRQGRNGSGGEQGSSNGQGTRGHASRGVRQGSGVDRGGESQPLVFGDQAEMDPERLAFEPLPQGKGGDEAEELWGLQAADPLRHAGPGGAGGAQGTSARGDATAGPGAAPLLPRNRDLVKRYFGGE